MARKTPAAKGTGKKATRSRVKWLSAKSDTPLIEKYARRLGSFMKALADGKVDDAEVKEQEARLIALMKEVEPELDDRLHAKVTQLLCELTAYDLMQVLNSMHRARPRTAFRG